MQVEGLFLQIVYPRTAGYNLGRDCSPFVKVQIVILFTILSRYKINGMVNQSIITINASPFTACTVPVPSTGMPPRCV
jgi:hypothetical protein